MLEMLEKIEKRIITRITEYWHIFEIALIFAWIVDNLFHF